MDVGSAAYKSLKNASKRDSISADQVHGFRNDCKRIVMKILDKIHEYIDSSAARIRSFSCLDPALIAENPSLALSRFTSMKNYFVSTGLVTSAVADASKQEFRTVITLNDHSLYRLDDEKERLDDFYYKRLMCKTKYKSLSVLLKLVFIISHGQGSVERGFNINKDHARTNITGASLMSRRLTVDYLESENVDLEEYVVPKELLAYGRSAGSRRNMDLEQNKKEKVIDEKARKLIKLNDEILHLKEKKKKTY